MPSNLVGSHSSRQALEHRRGCLAKSFGQSVKTRSYLPLVSVRLFDCPGWFLRRKSSICKYCREIIIDLPRRAVLPPPLIISVKGNATGSPIRSLSLWRTSSSYNISITLRKEGQSLVGKWLFSPRRWFTGHSVYRSNWPSGGRYEWWSFLSESLFRSIYSFVCPACKLNMADRAYPDHSIKGHLTWKCALAIGQHQPITFGSRWVIRFTIDGLYSLQRRMANTETHW